MASTDKNASDPIPGVTSISTTDFDTTMQSETQASRAPTGPDQAEGAVRQEEPGNIGKKDPATGETELWQDRYAFGNFAARFLIGFALIALCLFFVYRAADPNERYYRPLAILSGVVTGVFWIWLAFNIFRSRFGHHYRLTTRRLFVSSGIFRRQEDMMELNDLKEVTVNQEAFFDHVCKVGHVVVTSSVKGAPTLILVGVQNPQQVSDLIYKNAREESANPII